MLHTISWKEYWTLMGLGLGLYYGWLLVRYYPGLKIDRREKADRDRQVLPDFVKMKAAAGSGAAGKPNVQPAQGQQVPAGVAAGVEEVIGKPDQAGPAGKQGTTQMELLMSATGAPGKAGDAEADGEGSLPVPAVVKKKMFLPVLTGDLRMEIWRLLGKLKEGAMADGELLFSIEGLLSREPFNRLKGTTFEEQISAEIVRELERHGSIHVDANVVKGWWK